MSNKIRTKTYKTSFKLRRGVSTEWEEKNPVLLDGEPGFEIDTYKLKIGDGLLSWNDLPYISGRLGEKLAELTIGDYVYNGTEEVNIPVYNGAYKDDNEALLFNLLSNNEENIEQKLNMILEDKYAVINPSIDGNMTLIQEEKIFQMS